MGRIDFVGDIHGQFHHLRRLSKTTRSDAIVQLGDFGQMPKAKCSVDPYNPFQTPTYFIPGNHDDHDWLEECGHNTALLPGNLHYLGRVGEIDIEGANIAYIGGGYSIDQQWRTEGISWWKQEQPTKKEVEEFSSYQPDIAISHEGPSSVVSEMMDRDIRNSTARNLENLLELVPEFKPKVWLFGHHHPYEITYYYSKGIHFLCLPIFTGSPSQIFRVDTYRIEKSVKRNLA